MNILVGITGSSSAKVSHKLVEALVGEGNCVQVVFTDWGKRLDNQNGVSCVLTGWQDSISFGNENPSSNIKRLYPNFHMALNVHDDSAEEAWWAYDKTVLHVELAKWADVTVIAPCTSNTLAKINNGISDNLLTSIVRVFEKDLYVAPAMNTKMLKKAIQEGWLHSSKYKTLWPTTKMLTCGEFGMGAMADVYDIVNIVTGHKWANLINCNYNLHGSPLVCGSYMDVHKTMKSFPHPGWFGSVRKHDMHAGVDLYCDSSHSVCPFEDGEVVSWGQFTGEAVGSPWWNDTEYVSVKGKSGIIVYGEIKLDDRLKSANKRQVKAGSHCLGQIRTPLKSYPKEEIYGHRMDMLHIELLAHDAPVNFVEAWKHGEDRPKYLKDPTIYLGCLK
jgi:phosphopantothenoylcysteine decarboxylase